MKPCECIPLLISDTYLFPLGPVSIQVLKNIPVASEFVLFLRGFKDNLSQDIYAHVFQGAKVNWKSRMTWNMWGLNKGSEIRGTTTCPK